jgi:hypothetical protein
MSTPEEMTEKEKAESFLLQYLEEVQRGNSYASDLTGWLVNSLTPDALKSLAKDWDDSQERETE